MCNTIYRQLKSMGEHERVIIKNWIRLTVYIPLISFIFSVGFNCFLSGRFDPLFFLLNWIMFIANIMLGVFSVAVDCEIDNEELKVDTEWHAGISFGTCWIIYSFISGSSRSGFFNTLLHNLSITVVFIYIVSLVVTYMIFRKGFKIRIRLLEETIHEKKKNMDNMLTTDNNDIVGGGN